MSSTTGRPFVDTNVAIYALGKDDAKRARARGILDGTPVVSTQVVNETVSVLIGKQQFSRGDAYQVARALMGLCEVAAVSADTVRRAMQVGTAHGLGHWDALIVAAALDAGCDTLYSEDMQDGRVFEQTLTVRNPFVSA